jgi:hypothetical protein
MKSCPACGRTYVDDTFTFCLDDGALLSAPYDPQTTLQIPAARDTDQPRTDIIRTPPPPANPQTSPQQATTQPSEPLNYSYQAAAEPSSQRRSKASLVVGGVIVFLTAGVLILGYLAWRNSQSSASEVAKGDANVPTQNAASTPTAQVNSNVSVHPDGGTNKPKGNPNPQWLEGVWEGTGYQHTPKMTWSIKFTAENNTYAIEYPSLRCGGKWTLVEMDETTAKFKETINRGLERCSNDGDILIKKISDEQITYKYTLPIIGEVATATLSKEAAR